MDGIPTRKVLKELEETFGSRFQTTYGSGLEGAASVAPMNTEELQLLSKIAFRNSVKLLPLGAGTTPGPAEEGDALLVRFDFMRHVRLPEGEPWVEAEPGVVWLELEDELRLGGRGLPVYPTSAPRATVGGALATNGLGVGSFEYGRMNENVLSAKVVLPGGELREVGGEELQTYDEHQRTGIIVDARLQTRVARSDVPFAVAFGRMEDLLRAVTEAVEVAPPFWHLAFLNPAMARARSLGENYLLFGAYPAERSEGAEAGIQSVSENHGGEILPAAEAHRVWTERFFPVAPAHEIPDTGRTFLPSSELAGALSEMQNLPKRQEIAFQGTVARSGEVLLLAFEP